MPIAEDPHYEHEERVSAIKEELENRIYPVIKGMADECELTIDHLWSLAGEIAKREGRK